MRNWMKQTVMLCVLALVLFAFAGSAGAAPQKADGQATMQIKLTVDKPHFFWEYTFLTKDYILAKPSQVKVIWSVGQVPKGEKSEVALNTGKNEGQVAITTAKGELVSVQVAVCDDKGHKLGSVNLQVPNNGQTESIIVATPEYTEPQMTWSNL